MAVILVIKKGNNPKGILFVVFTTVRPSLPGIFLTDTFTPSLLSILISFNFRYDELLNVHGHVAPFAQVSLRPPKKADVWVQFGEQRWNEKNLSLHMTMKELKGM